MYPPPPTTEAEDRLTAAEKAQYSFQPIPLHRDDESYYPERLALEVDKPKRGRPRGSQNRPKYTLVHQRSIEVSDDDTETAEERSEPNKAWKSSKAKQPTTQPAKLTLIRQKTPTQELSDATISNDTIPDDTIVVDVGDEKIEDLSELREALKRSEAKLKIAKQKTQLLADLKKVEDELAAEEDKSTNFIPVKSGRKRKAVSEPEDSSEGIPTFKSPAKKIRRQKMDFESEDSPEPRRRLRRSNGFAKKYAE